jgi:HlyB family type I secretion system ABC transporter
VAALRRLSAPYRTILLHLFLATFVIQMLGIVPPLIIQNILDGVVVHQNVSLLHLLIGGLIIANVFSQLMATVRAYLANYMVRNLDFSMMAGFFKHTMSLPFSFFAKRKTGDIIARFQENQTIRAFLTESTVTTMLNLLMVFIYFSILFVYNVKLTLILIAFVIPIMALTVLATPHIKQYAREVFNASTDAHAFLMEALGGVETIKGMGSERPVRLKWEKKYVKALDTQYRAQQFNILVGLASQLLNAGTTIAILWAGASLVLEHELTIGQLIAFNALMGSVLAPLMGLVALWSRLADAGVAMERLGDVLDIEPEQKPSDAASRVVLPDLQGDLKLENVYFRYGGDDTSYVLDNISIDMRRGELIAIVGRSGSGKTTLAKLLVGFYMPTDGKILVDGYDMATIDKDYYRAQVGYVMQSNLLFSGTIAENIASGDDSPDRRRIEQVAKMADAHAFISKMPLGYEQVVGERGVGLSGGQVQRLCIARALYHDPRLLVFDEATSALDTQSESNIIANMHDILAGRTAVIIAHRLSTIMRADKIVVLYEGHIAEQGRHDELLARRGMYYELVQKQLAALMIMKLFNQDLPPRGSMMSYAGLLERLEILRSTLRWANSLDRPEIEKLLRQANAVRDEVMQLSHKERFVQALGPFWQRAADQPAQTPGDRKQALLARSFVFEGTFGDNPRLLDALEIAEKAAPTDLPVLIDGESGTGKELMAKVVHANGTRADKPYISVNCGAIPESLIESELFGHKRGAFTGAATDRKGKFESAHKGTIFLDEIGELPLQGQVKLLRVLQSHEIQRVGSDEVVVVDARIVAATNKNLRKLIEQGNFAKTCFTASA